MSKPEKSNQPTANQKGRTRRPAKWTYLELIGLALSFLLIIGPVLLLLTDTIFPGKTARADNVAVTKVVNNPTPAPGTNVIYTITIKNTSGFNDFATLSDTVPAGLTYVSSSTTLDPQGTTTFANGLVEASGPLNDNAMATLTVTCKVNSNVANNTQINNTATGDLAQRFGPVPASAQITVTIVGTPNLTATAQAANATATAGAAIATQTAGAIATLTAAAAPTNTPVPAATNTPVPAATNTPAPAPTNTPSGNGGGGNGGGGAATATSTVPGVPAGTNAAGNGGTVTAVAATLIAGLRSPAAPGAANTPTGTNPTSTANSGPAATATNTRGSGGVAPSVSGVVSGAYSSNVGGLSGTQVSLVRRGGGTDETIKTALIDGSNQYFFSGVPTTSPGQVYFVRYSNTDPGSGLLRLFSSNPFSFAGGTYRVPTADVSDVRTGPPGTSNTAFQLPLSLSWFVRSSEDRYSVTVFRASSGPILDSGNLGANTSFTVQNGQLTEGNYLAQINVVNPLGTGIANRQFAFRVVPGILLQPTSTRGAAAVATASAPTSTAAAVVATATATATSGGPQVSGNNSQPTTAPSPSAVAANQGGPGNPATNLPPTGGELPVFGLMLAGFTLLMRRVRLVRQTR